MEDVGIGSGDLDIGQVDGNGQISLKGRERHRCWRLARQAEELGKIFGVVSLSDIASAYCG